VVTAFTVPVAVTTVVRSPLAIFSVLNWGLFSLLLITKKAATPIITKIATLMIIFFIAIVTVLSQAFAEKK
jgi:hypothetical protein